MVADGGQEVAFHGTYREIVPDERIVTTEIYEGVPEPEPGEEVVDTMILAEANGRTRRSRSSSRARAARFAT